MTSPTNRRSRTIGRRLGGVAAVVALVVLAGLSSLAPAPAGAQEASPEVGLKWLQVDAGFVHTCAVTTTHRLFCFGFDGGGALGDGNGRHNSNVPVEVAGHTTDWAAVSAGYDQTCALKLNGHLFCWGTDIQGVLGDAPGHVDRNAPVEVAGHTGDWASVSAGGATCAIKTNGHLFCWGPDYQGVLGNGVANSPSDVPTEVFGSAADWQSVSVGFAHVCARKTTGRLRCWGDDTYGQLGNGEPHGNSSAQSSPVPVTGDATDWATVSTASNHTCATKTSGRLFCWGLDSNSALGAPDQDDFNLVSPGEVTGATANWATVSAGFNATCGRRTAGRLYCWGATVKAGLGQTFPYAGQPPPTLVPGGITDWTAVSMGSASGCALRTNGVLYCWGNNHFGQVGVGSTAGKIVGPHRVVV